MVSDNIKQELHFAYERLAVSFTLILFWSVLSILNISGIFPSQKTSSNFIIYSIISSSSVILLFLGLGIQIEPLIAQMIKNRNNIKDFWETQNKIEPDIYKRATVSKVFIVLGLLSMLISLLYVLI